MKDFIFSKRFAKGQLDLGIQRQKEPDRNSHLGGRSFYFFDFDDNVAFLKTPTHIFHKESGQLLSLSTAEYAQHSRDIGHRGKYKDYYLSLDDASGSYARFRDQKISLFAKIFKNEKQSFLHDLEDALKQSTSLWQGPSWNCFYHAVFNHRPIAIITARGHAPETIFEGFKLMKRYKHIPYIPNVLAIYPVSHDRTRQALGDTQFTWSVPELKKAAIRQAVKDAFKVYGNNPHHRFGMSDDDPANLEMIQEELKALKLEFPKNSFYMFNTGANKFIKYEVSLVNSEQYSSYNPVEQLDLL